jgi:hypothetical protein
MSRTGPAGVICRSFTRPGSRTVNQYYVLHLELPAAVFQSSAGLSSPRAQAGVLLVAWFSVFFGIDSASLFCQSVIRSWRGAACSRSGKRRPGSAGSDFTLLALGHGVHGTRGSNRQRVQRTRMRSVRAARQMLFRHRVYSKLLRAQQYVQAQQKAAVCTGGPKV